MSEGLQDIEHELAADQSELCSDVDFSEKQNVNASESIAYINAVAIVDLEGLLTSDTEDGLHTGSIVVDNYTYENTGANEYQVDGAACDLTEAMSNEPPTDNITATEVSCTIVPASSSPKKLVALPSEATVMVDGQKCVLRVDHNTGRLLACPVAGDARPFSLSTKRLPAQEYSSTNVLLEARRKSVAESVNIGVTAAAELESSELSDCNLDISCSTVTQSASSPSEPDQENSTPPDGVMTVLKADETESNEMLSDSSTVSADNSSSTASAPSSSELEQESSSRQRLRGLAVASSHRRGQVKKKLTVAKDLGTNCEMPYSIADVTVCQPAAVNTDVSSKDQIVISASNRVQNYLAGLGLPVKRGRGRPRRKPLPPEELSSVMVVDGGNAIPLTESELKSSLPLLLSNVVDPSPAETQTSIIIEQEDGTEKHIVLATSQTAMVDSASSENLSVDDISSGKFYVEGNDGQTAHNDVMHVVMLPKREPVKIAMRASDVDLVKLKCQKCEFQAVHPHQLQQHLSDEHTDELVDLVRCRCCNFLFFAEDDLKEHFKKNHPKNMCTDCGFMSEHLYVIRRHMQRHSMAGCECHVCGRRYKDQYILKMHIKMRHMAPEVLFQCNLCSKMFTRKAHLKRHLRIHNPDKPYKCPHCDYRGCERSDITKHVLIHVQPQHTCDVCGKSFRHIKNKELHLKRHRGQRDYKCVFCEFYGYTYTDIRKHQERKHAGSRTLVCDRCCMTFRSEHLLQVHQQIECQPIGASDSEINEVADSSDVLRYVTDGSQLPAVDAELVASTGEAASSSSDYKVFVNGNPDGLNLLEAQIVGSEAMSNVEMMDCDGNIGLVSPVVEVPLSLLEQ